MRILSNLRAACGIGLLSLFLWPAVGQAEGNRAFGILISLDAENHSIQIRDPRSGVLFMGTVTDTTVVTDGDEEIDMEDVAPGTAVIVDYSQPGDIPEVSRIAVRKDLE